MAVPRIQKPTRGLQGLAAVPVGSGGVSIPQRSPNHFTFDYWLPRGVGFVPGAAWPARPLDARAASYARRVVSKPGQALQALRRPTQGRRLLSTV